MRAPKRVLGHVRKKDVKGMFLGSGAFAMFFWICSLEERDVLGVKFRGNDRKMK